MRPTVVVSRSSKIVKPAQAIVLGLLSALALTASSAAASPVQKPSAPLSAAGITATVNAWPPPACPSASVVNAALGQKNKAPVSAATAYSKTCTYKGGGIVPTRITFQRDTTATFAAGEKAAAAVAPVVKISGLGRAAWAPKGGGGLYVLKGSVSLKIVSPLTTIAKLETLARKIL
jgi:hypothetical protein